MTILSAKHIPRDTTNTPIYLLHTLILDSTYLFDSIANPKIFDRDLYFIDLPNHGNSDDIDLTKLDFELMADCVEAFRKDHNHQKIILFGHGFGGFVAQYYVTKYGNKIDRLILSNTAPNNRYREEMAWNIRERFDNAVKKALDSYYGKIDEKSVRARFTQSFAVHFKPTNHDLSKELMDNAKRIAADTYVHLSVNVIPKFSLREKIRNFTKQTLLIATKDDVWPLSGMLFLQNDLTFSQLLVLEGGHFSMVEGKISAKYWKSIAEWINKE